MRSFFKIMLCASAIAVLSGCQTMKQEFGNAKEQVQSSSLQFQRLMASLNMQKYVPGLPDMPVYHGFKPQGNENAVYDVVEGRIIDITYASDIAELEKVKDFYAIALEQLGWVQLSKQHYYQRDDETLYLEVKPSGQTVMLHIWLAPSDK